MKKIFGISLILIGIFSGGMGVAVMGGGLAIPGFLVIAFGIYLLFSSSANKNKKISSILLGILILIFGFINLINGSLIMISLISIIVGGGLIFYAFSNKEEIVDIPNDLKSRIRAKINKKKPKKKRSVLRFFVYAIGIPGFLIGILILMGS
jgi:hypothetical protein